ncbi:hypothetical protein [Thiolapillus sp.]|uniref:hypothetical protein n=3 Tax=Thiolapillus sp. TaxID=2017437 RepID=UPI003AF6011B
MCLRPRDRSWDIPVPKIDSAFDNLFVPQPSWSPSTTQQLRKLLFCTILFEKFRQTETFLKLDDILCHVRHLTKTLILCMFYYSPISVCVAEYRG